MWVLGRYSFDRRGRGLKSGPNDVVGGLTKKTKLGTGKTDTRTILQVD